MVSLRILSAALLASGVFAEYNSGYKLFFGGIEKDEHNRRYRSSYLRPASGCTTPSADQVPDQLNDRRAQEEKGLQLVPKSGSGNKNGRNKNGMNGGNRKQGVGNKKKQADGNQNSGIKNGGNKNGGNKNGGNKGPQQMNGDSPEIRNLRASSEGEELTSNVSFDFIVAGFPKCGTTTLLKAFAAHDETDMAESEKCVIASPGQSDAIVHKKLDETLEELSKEPHVKRAFKCPTTMYNYKSIVRMEKHSPNAKFVVGMRHPVKMLQSFYNYRITEIHERGLDEEIPLLEDVLAADEPWKGVSIESTRFELFLMQMGKTSMTPEQQQDLVGKKYELAIKPTNFTVFLYTVDQLEDDNEERTGELRRVMQEYLGLSKPIQPFGHENKNHATGDAGHKETINICDEKWRDVRATLVMQGAKTAAWLREHFIHSPDVIVANKEHFVETLNSWGTDPCEAKVASQ